MALDVEIYGIHGHLRQVSYCSIHHLKSLDLHSQLLLPEHVAVAVNCSRQTTVINI